MLYWTSKMPIQICESSNSAQNDDVTYASYTPLSIFDSKAT